MKNGFSHRWLAAMLIVAMWLPVDAIRQAPGLVQQEVDVWKGAHTSNFNKQSARNLDLERRGKGGKGSKKGEEEPACDSETRTLNRTVLVTFQDLRSDTITDDQRAALEEAFLVTYNRLSEELCPEGSFRTVLNVTFGIDPPTRRRLRRDAFPNKGGKTFPGNITWGCNDRCPRNAQLLKNDAGRRSLQDDLERRSSSNDNGDTECTPCETPTPEVFTMNYNEVIVDFEESLGLILGTVGDVTELVEIECDDDITLQSATLTIPFNGNTEEATPDQLAAVAQGVKQTLNSLNVLDPDTCDEFFRVVIAAEAVVNNPREERGRRELRFKSQHTTVVNVVWQCKNTCPQGTILQQNDAGRRGRQLPGRASFPLPATLRELQEEGQCLCPAGATEFQLPMRYEFDAAFNETIEILIDQNVVTFIDTVGEVTEAEEITCPTEQEERETILTVQVDAEPDIIQDNEIAVVATLIELVYLDLTSRLCFEGVRTIVEVSLVQITGVDVETTGVETETIVVRKLMFKKAKLAFNIVFSCQKCPTNGKLTNDAARRLSPPSVNPFSIVERHGPRHLQNVQGEQCFCDVDFVNEARIPTTRELEAALSDAIDASPELNFTSARIVTETEATPAPITMAPITPAPVTPSPITPRPITASPVTSSPVTPSPVTQAPVTPSPVTQAPATFSPVTSSPVTLAPVTSSPVTSAPVTSAPVTAAPVTSAPVTQAPVTLRPITTSPITEQPVAPLSMMIIQYVVAIRNGENGTFAEDLVGAMDQLATLVASQAFPAGRRRRRLTVLVELPTTLTNVLDEACPSFVSPTDECLEIFHTITVRVESSEDSESDTEEFRSLLNQAILDGVLQTFVDQINSSSDVYIVTGLSPFGPDESTPVPIEPPVETPAPVAIPPEDVPGTNVRQTCVYVYLDFALGIIECSCREGWMGDNGCFQDIRECDAEPCAFPGGFCVEKSGDQGQYACGCQTGWEPSGEGNIHGPTLCQLLVNPCDDGAPCDPDATCTDSEAIAGEFSCSCNDGFVGDGFQCTPDPEDNEQATAAPAESPPLGEDPETPASDTPPSCETVTCPANNECIDTLDGTTTCVCQPGFEGGNNGRSACTDTDECCEGCNNGCHEFADCANIPGSFFCVCQNGYVDAPGSPKQGTDCIPLNECSKPELNNCDPLVEVCIDRPPPGATTGGGEDGFECTPITPSPTLPPTEQPVTPAPTPRPPPPPAPPTCISQGGDCSNAGSRGCCSPLGCLDNFLAPPPAPLFTCQVCSFIGSPCSPTNRCCSGDCIANVCTLVSPLCIGVDQLGCSVTPDCCDGSTCDGNNNFCTVCGTGDFSAGCNGDDTDCCSYPVATCPVNNCLLPSCSNVGEFCGTTVGGTDIGCCSFGALCVSGLCDS